MNGSVEIRNRYNRRVARRHMAICYSARFQELHQFLKMSSSVFAISRPGLSSLIPWRALSTSSRARTAS